MVKHFLRLKLRLLANSFRRSPLQLVGAVLSTLFGLGVASVAASVLTSMRFVDLALATDVVVSCGALVVVGFLFVPLAFGVDDTMDPRRFSLFGLPTGQLTIAIAASALISVPAVVIAVVALSQIVTWSYTSLSLVVAVVSAVLIIVTCVVGARVTTSIAAVLLSTRRARELTSLATIVFIVLLAPTLALLVEVNWRGDAIGLLHAIAGVATWTPFGAVWAAPADAAAGDLAGAAVHLLIAVAFVGLLAVTWRALVAAILVTPQRQPQARNYRGLGWFRHFPATAAGVITARTLSYWGRDPRYAITLVVVPIVPLVMVIPLAIAGVPNHTIALLPVPIMALFLAWANHNDLAFDNTAIWLHVAAGTPGSADRIGRSTPALLFGAPVILIASFICTSFFGDWWALPAILGVSLCIVMCGLGVSAVMSAAFPYPAARPGDSPFTQPQSGSTPAPLIQAACFFAIVLVSSPATALAVLGIFIDGPIAIAALVVGVLIGAAVLRCGILLGGQIFDSRAPELLAFAMRN